MSGGVAKFVGLIPFTCSGDERKVLRKVNTSN